MRAVVLSIEQNEAAVLADNGSFLHLGRIELKEAADAVGVKLILNGDIPRKLRKLIAIAIHECLTNTVKHADGSELTVDITDEDGIVTVVFTNDGKPPEGEISESGGLKSLRSTVEQFRGEMEIASEPRFMLTIRVSGKE